jgi:hypothetical protein
VWALCQIPRGPCGAGHLHAAYYEELFALPLEQVRRELGIPGHTEPAGGTADWFNMKRYERFLSGYGEMDSERATTTGFYARWIEETTYREPVRLAPGEVPADILARLGSHQSLTTEESDDADDLVTTRNEWHAGRDSNPRPSGSKPDALSS